MAGKSNEIQFILEGLDCSNCAMKIEKKIGELQIVNNASLSFATKVLTCEFDSGKEVELEEEVKNIVKQTEPHVVVKRKNSISKGKEKNSHIHVYNHQTDGGCSDGCCSANGISSDHSSKKESTEGYCSDGCGCSGEGFDDTEGSQMKKNVIQFGISFVIFAIATILKLPFYIELSMYLISFLLSGGEVLLKAIKNLVKGDFFDENFLMSVATIGAFAIGEFPEGAAVMLFYQVGEMLQGFAVYRSRKSITELMDIRPDYATIISNGIEEKVSPDEVTIGQIMVVKPGEKVALDGTIIEGQSSVDTMALTGESLPREVGPGDTVLSGFINKNGLLKIQVIRDFEDSTVSKILDLVENASSKKAPTENFITKFARKYTPVVTIAALILAIVPPLIIPSASFSQWIYRALIFLVISCPCALVVSIPLGFFGGIGGASKQGVLVKGSNYLEALNYVDTVVFDKTGTLTKGIFKVTKVVATEGLSKDELLRLAAYAEIYSNHPIATSILNAYDGIVDKNLITKSVEVPGHGLKVQFEGKEIVAGNGKLMEQEEILYTKADEVGTVVYIGIDGKYAGYLLIADEVKEDAKETITSLKEMGMKTVLLTGDSKVVGEKVASDLGIDKVYAELLPDEKVYHFEEIEKTKQAKKKVAFVGDGINDAPVLARADIGIAMGGLGSDAAIEAADVVLMTDEPSKIINAIQVAKKTHRIVWQNIILALGIKAVVLLLGALGSATMWEAVFADVGVALLAVLNAMRAMKVDKSLRK